MSVGLPAPGGSHSPTHTHTCMRASVAGSVLAVASSRTITLLCDSRARARHSSCRWPTLRFCPPDSMGASRPPMCDTYSFMSTRSSASHSSRSLGAAATCDSLTRSATGSEAAMSASPSRASRAAWGLRLERMLPWNSVGSWRERKPTTVSSWQGYGSTQCTVQHLHTHLWDDTEVLPQVMEADGVNVHAINDNRASF